MTNQEIINVVRKSFNVLSDTCKAHSHKEIAEVILQPGRLQLDNPGVDVRFLLKRTPREQVSMVAAIVRGLQTKVS